MKSLLIIFAKPPMFGKVKTRLAQTIGNDEALRLYTLMLEKTLDLGDDDSWQTEVFFSEKTEFTEAFTRFSYSFQSSGTIGDKMSNAFIKAFKSSWDKIVLIGADCPDNSIENIKMAFDSLSENEVVLGPSEDGGYYLIGLKSPQLELFKDIEWSVPSVFENTLKKARKNELSTASVRVLNDIDNQEDLKSSAFFKTIKI